MLAYTGKGQQMFSQLMADRVDMPARAYPCDVVPQALAASISDPKHVFPNGPPYKDLACA